MNRALAVCALALLAAACQSPQKASAPAAPGASKADAATPVAKVAGEIISAKDLEEKVGKQVRKMEAKAARETSTLRYQALEAMVQEKVLEAKAKKEGLTAEKLIERDVASKLPEPTEAEMRKLYDEAAARGQQLPPFDQVKEQIARYLKGQLFPAKAMEYVQELQKAAGAEILLPPYREAVDASGPSKGPADAPITIVEFSDFQCPYCVRAEPTVKQVLDAYPGKVRLVYKDFPLPSHTLAPDAAEAAHCAGDQGKYWEMHGRLFEAQGKLAVVDLKDYAKGLGLETAKFDACLDSNEKDKVVKAHADAGDLAGVEGTPAFFINGRFLNGAQPVEAFKKVIDEELAARK